MTCVPTALVFMTFSQLEFTLNVWPQLQLSGKNEHLTDVGLGFESSL
jgi:hypothetical protein